MRNEPAVRRTGAVPYAFRSYRIVWKSGGELQPWLGPALRGITARTLKNSVCRHPPAIRDTRWIHCAGCPQREGCVYGDAFEPEIAPGTPNFGGQDEAFRCLTISPRFPAPPQAVPGEGIEVEIAAWGPPAAELSAIEAALAEAGRSLGLGPRGARFDLQPLHRPDLGRLAAAMLPRERNAAEPPVTVEVRLSAPLFLRVPGDGHRRWIEHPEFADLLRGSLRSLGQLFRLHADPLDADFADLKAAAATVRTAVDAFRPFSQRKWSNRSEQGFELHGACGSACFADVPPGLVPWLEWGGRVRIGTHRVAGAGGWQVFVAANTPRSTNPLPDRAGIP